MRRSVSMVGAFMLVASGVLVPAQAPTDIEPARLRFTARSGETLGSWSPVHSATSGGGAESG